VDGLHIRTLLLTFFYRQMPELIERGHIYIAQPPLYKVKKGKQERYVKNDGELNDYLLQLALENANLHVNAEVPPITDVALETLAKQYLAVIATKDRLSRRYHANILEKMIYMPAFNAADMSDEGKTQQWFGEIINRLNAGDSQAVRYELRLEKDPEQNMFVARINQISHGVSDERPMHNDFFNSSEYRAFVALGEQLDGLIGEGAFIQRGERKKDISSFKEALTWLMDEARRGQHIQRYKGLGEMNPEQLWETTLDVNNRRLLQVQIEDAVAADEIFTTLMGDQVEPRRDFIESNALEVENLDV
jgi:DNA gyrase subunit B